MKPLAILFALSALISGHAAAAPKPNIVFILADDCAEQHDLAAKLPDKLKELEQAWQRPTDGFSELARKTVSK